METKKKVKRIRIIGLILGILSIILVAVSFLPSLVILGNPKNSTKEHIAIFLLFKALGLFFVGMFSGFSISEGSNRGRLIFLLVYPVLIVLPLIFIPVAAVYQLLIADIIFYLIFCALLILPGTKEELKELMWDITCKNDNIRCYQRFLSRHPNNFHRQEAEKRISQIENEQRFIQDTINRVLPETIHGNVNFIENNIHISAHLLEAYSPDSTDPTVKGAYGSHSALTDYVNRRIAEIYRMVFNSAKTLKIGIVTVECRHGVHHIVIGGPGGGNYANTLYKTSLKGEAAKKLNWHSVSNEAIQKAWLVETNIIPTLQIRSSGYSSY